MLRILLTAAVISGGVAVPSPVDPLAILASERAKMPENLEKLDKVLETPSDNANAPQILVVGDSWADVVASGSAAGLGFFQGKLKKHGCKAGVRSIAVPGTMASDWSNGEYLEKLKQGAKTHDYVWIVLLGNDALEFTGSNCGLHIAPEKCGDMLFAKTIAEMYQIVDAIHEVNPNATVMGFGYDTMFGGLGCGAVTRLMFPRCYLPRGGGNACFNKQFLRIQEVFDTVAANRSFVKKASILGATQVAGGDARASTGADRHIDMDKMGPAKYWPDYLGCFHPGVLGEDCGANVVMEEFVRTFWVDELKCSHVEESTVVV